MPDYTHSLRDTADSIESQGASCTVGSMTSSAQVYPGQDLEALADIPNYQNWILQHFAPYLRGRVLEIGAGTGNFSQLYLPDVREAVLLEPAQNLTARLRERAHGAGHASVVPLQLEEACAQGKVQKPFDAVVLINVLEHVDDDRAMLERILELLRPGGYLLLFVPALSMLFGSLDTMLEHRRRYALRPLRALVQEAGFEVLDDRYFDFLGVLPWFVAGRVLRQTRFNPDAAKLYDQTGVRVGAFAERFVKPPVGKNILCIARRER